MERPIGSTFQWMKEARGAMMSGFRLQALEAGITPAHRVLSVAADIYDRVVLVDRKPHAAGAGTNPTERCDFAIFHGPTPVSVILSHSD